MKKSSATTRGLVLLVLSTIFCVALLFFPRKSKGAAGGPQNRKSDASTSATAVAAASTPPPAAPSASATHATSPATEPTAKSASEARTIPTGKGLPVLVSVGVYYLDVRAFDDTKGEFECTADVRMRWIDPRLVYPKREAFKGYREYRGSAANEKLAEIWVPNVESPNRIEPPSFSAKRVRIFPDGQIEVMSRTTARYRTLVDAQRFPFDQQHLVIESIVREDTTDEVLLDYQKDEVEFSRHAPGMELAGWTPGLVKLSRRSVAGWNGDRYSGVQTSLDVDRQASSGIAPIFIPLVASLLIPMLAVWMNKVDEEGWFAVDAFELANIIIGGLFSVIALSFAIYTSYGVIAGGDNTVTRLFAVNYLALAVSLMVVILFFRFNLPRRLFGAYVQEQMFLFVSWAMPALTIGCSTAFLLVAAA